MRFPIGPLAALSLLAAALTSPWWPIWLVSIPGPSAYTPLHTDLRAIADLLDDLDRHLREDRDLLLTDAPPYETVFKIRQRAEGAYALARAAEQRAIWLAAEAPAFESSFGLSRMGQDLLHPILAEHFSAIGYLSTASNLEQVAPPEPPGRPKLVGPEAWRGRLDRIRAPIAETAERLRGGRHPKRHSS